MTPLELIESLTAFYNQELNKVQVDAWVEELMGYDNLETVYLEWRATRKWMPKLSEILELAREQHKEKVMRESDFLRGEAQILEDEYHQRGTLNASRWNTLIDKFITAGRKHAAEDLRTRWARYGT